MNLIIKIEVSITIQKMQPEQISKRKKSFLRSLHKKKMRYRRNSFLIEGKKNTLEGLKADWDITRIYFTDEVGKAYLEQISDNIKKKNININKTYPKELEKVSTLVNPEGILAVGKIKKQKELSKFNDEKILFLDRIRNPGNLGTVLRSALWFGLDRVLLSKGSVDPFNPKVVRGSMGSLFYLDFNRNITLSQIQAYSQKQNLEILGADMSGTPINKLDELPSNFILCMGNESHGLKEEIIQEIDRLISIPKKGKGESLNLAVSSAILMKDLMME